MRRIRRILRAGRVFWLGLFVLLAIALSHKLTLGGNLGTAIVPPPAAAASPNPKLPEWIEQISPTGQAEPLAQIRIRFKEPLIPLEQIESETQQKLLQQFEVSPALAGQFRFLTPRMVGFQADKALPQSTRLTVTLKAGLRDLQQHQLTQDFAWTFNTEPVSLVYFRGKTEVETIDLNPNLDVTANTELDLASLERSASLINEQTQERIPLQATLKQDDLASNPISPEIREREEAFYPGARERRYLLTPPKKLEKATPYRLEIAPGLRSAHGNIVSETGFKGQLKTYEPFAYQQLTFSGQPDSTEAFGRFTKGAPQLLFNNRLDPDSVSANITISPSPLTVEPKVRLDRDNMISLNPWIFEPNTVYTLTLGAKLKDEFGQTLGKPVTVSYQSGDVAPNLQVPMWLKILPVGTDLPLNISAVNLPGGAYQATYRALKPTDLIYNNENAYSQNGIPGMLPPPRIWSRFQQVNPILNKIQEIALPLREKLGGATGMVAYGVKARTYQYLENTQKKWREPIYYGVAQFTNLGVFAQRFTQGGVVWVHHLSDGSAVKAARVEVYPTKVGKTPHGGDRPCATGITDPTGTLTLGVESLRQCLKSQKDAIEPPNLLVIAHEQKDWAFVRLNDANYDYGVEPRWDSSNGLKPESRGIIFSDRKLYQPGETAWFTGVAYSLQGV